MPLGGDGRGVVEQTQRRDQLLALMTEEMLDYGFYATSCSNSSFRNDGQPRAIVAYFTRFFRVCSALIRHGERKASEMSRYLQLKS